MGTFKIAGNANSTFSGVTATVDFGLGGGNKVLQETIDKRKMKEETTMIIFLEEFIDFPPFFLKFVKGYGVRSLYPV
jgi:hypothetical protein